MFRQKGKVMGKCGWYVYCGSCFLQEGSHDTPGGGGMEGAVLTPEAAPASDVAGVVLRQQGARLRQAGHLDGVAQLHGLRELDESDVVAGSQSGSGECVGGPWQREAMLSSPDC